MLFWLIFWINRCYLLLGEKKKKKGYIEKKKKKKNKVLFVKAQKSPKQA